jgi:hypothetical protein
MAQRDGAVCGKGGTAVARQESGARLRAERRQTVIDIVSRNNLLATQKL